MTDKKPTPYHVAIIMDGNGRWAKRRGLGRNSGHKKGMENVEKILEHARRRGVKCLSLFAFSTENWTRPRPEIYFLFSSFKDYLVRKKEKLIREGIRLNVMGRRDGLPQDLILQIDQIQSATSQNKEMVLNIVFNYGGRTEISDAAKTIASDIKEAKLALSDVTEENFSKYLYNSFIPDVDLLIRTSGEERISNFLLWRLAYSEIYFTQTLWPDFSDKDFDKALGEFAKRERRYGGLKSNV